MGCCAIKKKPRNAFMTAGSHEEHHINLKYNEKASQVKIHANLAQLKAQYDINTHVLGKGAFGKVYKAEDKMNKEFKVAIKVLNKDKMTKKDLQHVMDEVDMLKKVDHPNIVEYFETYENEHFLYLVMELCTGGELFDRSDVYLKNQQAYTEAEAALVVFKCLEALQHCHSLGITHRDIKPENIMYGKDGEVRLVDFGLAKDSVLKMRAYAGTPFFMAPEVLNGCYTHKCDIWSLGCVLYMLNAGQLPFFGHTREEVFKKISRAEYNHCSTFSPELDSLIDLMFTLDPAERPTARELWTHAWFKKFQLDSSHQSGQTIDQQVLMNLMQFKGRSRLRRECLHILVKMINPSEFGALRKEFNKIDVDGSGTIEVEELREAVNNSNLVLTETELERILQEVDITSSGIIHYHEFLAATFPVEKYATRERLASLFQKFDTKGLQRLEPTTLRDAFTKLGHNLTSEEVKQILDEHDIDHDRVITQQEFEAMILDHM